MPATASFEEISAESFVSLTTFRRSGEAVSTPVWVGADGNALVVTTEVSTGKVKRIRHTPRVELRPCTRMGKVEEGAPVFHGTATIRDDAAARERLDTVLRKKYGLQYRLILRAERVFGGRGKPAHERHRVMLRIEASE